MADAYEVINVPSYWMKESDLLPYGFGTALHKFHQSVYTETVRRKKPEGPNLWSQSTGRTHYDTKVEYKEFTGKSGALYRHSTSAQYSPLISFPTSVYRTDDLVNLLAGRIRSHVKNQSVNVALSIKEGRQTVDMINNAFKDAFKTYRSLRREGLRSLRYLSSMNGRELPKGATRAQKEAANRWLEYQFGLKPVISDIYGLAHEAAKRVEEGVWFYFKTGGFIDLTDTTLIPGGRREWVGTSSGYVSGRYRISNVGARRASATGFTNIPALLWESVPYSFVFDALYDVGGFLEGLDAFNGVSSFEWFLVHKVRIRVRQFQQHPSYPGFPLLEAEGRHMYYNRAKRFDQPVGRPQWNSKAPSITRLTNYLALLRQLR